MIPIRQGVRFGVDVGSVRIGVSRCDATATLCVPVATVKTHDELLALIEEYEPIEIIVGLPVSMDGSEQKAAKFARSWATTLSERTAIPIRLIDERWSTASAARELNEAGLSTRQARGVVDQAAAVVILEQALAMERATDEPGGERL